MTSPFLSGVAVLAGGVLLSHCSGSGLTGSVRHACLAETAVSGEVTPIDGYPVSVLEDAWRHRGGTARLENGVLTLTSVDRLTGRTNVVRLEVQPGAKPFRSDQCGPETLVVSRMALNGMIASDLDMQDGLFPLVENAAADIGMKKPAVPQPPQAPPEPVSAIQAPPSSGPPAVATPPMMSDAPSLAKAQPTPGLQPSAPVSAPTGYSPAYGTCMAGGEAAQGVTSAVMSCTGDELARQDASLNQVYRARMATLAPAQAAALRAEERAWIHSRDAQCKARMEDAGGTLGAQVYARCTLDQTVSRVGALRSGTP